jgi:hypothetical protein
MLPPDLQGESHASAIFPHIRSVTQINPVAALSQLCDRRMRLARITPGASALDIRTFECVRCRHVHTATAETDPMQSDAVLWLASHDLRSPT